LGSAASHPLERDGDLWGTLVGAATVGSEYQFSLATGQGVLKRNDPVAGAMTSSVITNSQSCLQSARGIRHGAIIEAGISSWIG